MAIDYKGQVTTTGMMNQSLGANIQAPNMTNLTQPKQPTQPIRQSVRAEQPVKTAERSIPLTDEDMTVLAPVLTPSVKLVLTKIIPEISSLIEGIGPNEETVPIKVSIFTSLPDDIQNFIIQSSTQEMDTNNVPLDTAPQSSGMMARSQDDSSDIPQNDSAGVDISQDLV
jgi:hypothetical protein|tara:strand:+ start:54 stop:563 length:510 start_codon:yes stop_codon:yes gene_type:complete